MSKEGNYDIFWFRSFLAPYKWLVIKAMLFLSLVVIFSLLPPLLIKELVDSALPRKDINEMVYVFAWLVGALLLTAISQAIEEYYTANLGLRVAKDIRIQLYQHVQKMPTQFFLETKTGEITTRFTSDIFTIQRSISKTLPGLFTNLTMLVVALVIMLSLNVLLTIAALVTIPLYLVILFFIVKNNNRLAKRFFALSDSLNGNLTDNFSFEGQMHSRVNGLQNTNFSLFANFAEKLRLIRLKMGLLTRGNESIYGLLSMTGIALVYLVGGILTINDEVTIGTIIAFSVFVTRLYQPLSFFSTSAIELSSALVSATRIKNYFLMPQDNIYFNTENSEVANKRELSENAIVFEDVSFSYEKGDGKTPVLNDFNLTVKQGKNVAIVGPNGAGKSTLAQLLLGVYTSDSGEIYINGFAAKNMTYQEYSQNVCIVFSNSYFINGTIKENLQIVKPDLTDKELANALKLSQSDEFVESLDNGIHTKVGQGGYRLSSGQRQRLALARMFLTEAPIIICDEATSNLNSQAEQQVLDNLIDYFGDRTIVMISHCTSVIDKMDDIIEMNAQESLVERHINVETQQANYSVSYSK